MLFSGQAARQVDSRRVFVIAGPAMLANLTTPLLGVVSTGAIGQLGDAALLGGVALASVAFDCVFWLFGFLRMATVAFTAQALGADDRVEIREPGSSWEPAFSPPRQATRPERRALTATA